MVKSIEEEMKYRNAGQGQIGMSSSPSSTIPVKEFWQSLLQITVPVKVTLATKRMPVDQILKLVPGVMIQFDKAYESPMQVEVGEQTIAEGEVVKVGDKFGLRITEVLDRKERFAPIDFKTK